MYRDLVPMLANRHHVIALDMPGFGLTETPEAKTMEQFTEVLQLTNYASQFFDYGAPVGYRLAVARPERVTALISQNGNAYEEGLADGWDSSSANRVKNPSRVAPDGFFLDAALIARPGNVDIPFDRFLDYANNVVKYPQFQEYFRKYRPPILAVWGKNDPFFLNAGAEAFRRDVPSAEIRFFDTGHFALETHVKESCAKQVRKCRPAEAGPPVNSQIVTAFDIWFPKDECNGSSGLRQCDYHSTIGKAAGSARALG